MNSKLLHEIEQQERVVQDKTAAYKEAHAPVSALLKEIESLDKAGKLALKHKDKAAYANVRAKALNAQAEELLAEQNKLIELKNAIRDRLQKQHGLLAFGLASGSNALGPEAQLLHDTIGDYLNAKNPSDRQAATRSAKLLWEHGCIIKGETPGTSTPSIVSEFEAITDPERATAFYREHRNELLGSPDATETDKD